MNIDIWRLLVWAGQCGSHLRALVFSRCVALCVRTQSDYYWSRIWFVTRVRLFLVLMAGQERVHNLRPR